MTSLTGSSSSGTKEEFIRKWRSTLLSHKVHHKSLAEIGRFVRSTETHIRKLDYVSLDELAQTKQTNIQILDCDYDGKLLKSKKVGKKGRLVKFWYKIFSINEILIYFLQFCLRVCMFIVKYYLYKFLIIYTVEHRSLI